MKKSKLDGFSELFQGGISAASAGLTRMIRGGSRILSLLSRWSNAEENVLSQHAEWQLKGQELYRLSRSLLEEKQRFANVATGRVSAAAQKKMRHAFTWYNNSLTEENGADSSEGKSSISKCMLGEGTRFWGENGVAFCVYYAPRSDNKYDMYLEGFSHGRSLVARVNHEPFTVGQIRSCEPVFVASSGQEGHRITFAFLEYEALDADGEEYAKSLIVSEYLIEMQGSSFKSSHSRYTKLPYEGNVILAPLGITRIAGNDIVVVARSVGDRRVPTIDQGYFAWMFSSATLELQKLHGGYSNSYLFSRAGSSSREFPERLLIWDDVRDIVSLTYVSTYLATEKSRFFYQYAARSANFPAYRKSALGRAMWTPSRCFVETPLCHIGARGVTLSAEYIEHVQGISINGERYIVYVTRSNSGHRGKICVAHLRNGVYEVFQNIVTVKFPVSSLNARKIADDHLGVMIIEKGTARLHVYDIELSQLRSASEFNIDAVTVDVNTVDHKSFIDLAGTGAKIMSQDMQEAGSSRSAVSVTRGQMTGIPVAAKSRIISRIAEYVPYRRSSLPTETQQDVVSTTTVSSYRENAVMEAPQSTVVTETSGTANYTAGLSVSTRRSSTATAVIGLENRHTGGIRVCSNCTGSSGIEGERAVGAAPPEHGTTESLVSTESVRRGGKSAASSKRVVRSTEKLQTLSSSTRLPLDELRLPSVISQGDAELRSAVNANLSNSENTGSVQQHQSNTVTGTPTPRNSYNGTERNVRPCATETPYVNNGSTAPAVAPYKSDPISAALAMSSIAIILCTVLLVVGCLLYVRWRTGRFTQTQGMYRHLRDPVNTSSRNRRDIELNTRTYGRTPGYTLSRLEGASSGVECVTTQEL